MPAISTLHLVQMVDNGLGTTLLPTLAVDAGVLIGTSLVTRSLLGHESARKIGLVWRRGMVPQDVARLGERAEMPFSLHPHILRHSIGFLYANQGKDTRSLQAFLGRRNINSTVRYTRMSPSRFKGWERD